MKKRLCTLLFLFAPALFCTNDSEAIAVRLNKLNPAEVYSESSFRSDFIKDIIQKVQVRNSIEDMVLDSVEKYSSFRYSNEIPQILKHAKIVGVDPGLLMAIRSAEGAEDNLAYGIKPGNKWFNVYKNDKGYFDSEGNFHKYVNEKEKQLNWAAWTVRNNIKRFEEDSKGQGDFLSYLASVYAPTNASNDPKGLNVNWERNVREFYNKFKGFN